MIESVTSGSNRTLSIDKISFKVDKLVIVLQIYLECLDKIVKFSRFIRVQTSLYRSAKLHYHTTELLTWIQRSVLSHSPIISSKQHPHSSAAAMASSNSSRMNGSFTTFCTNLLAQWASSDVRRMNSADTTNGANVDLFICGNFGV